MLVDKTGEAREVGKPGTMLGVLPNLEVTYGTATLQPGESLVLYTDGLVEARHHGPLFGDRELFPLLRHTADRSAADIAHAILDGAVGPSSPDFLGRRYLAGVRGAYDFEGTAGCIAT